MRPMKTIHLPIYKLSVLQTDGFPWLNLWVSRKMTRIIINTAKASAPHLSESLQSWVSLSVVEVSDVTLILTKRKIVTMNMAYWGPIFQESTDNQTCCDAEWDSYLCWYLVNNLFHLVKKDTLELYKWSIKCEYAH